MSCENIIELNILGWRKNSTSDIKKTDEQNFFTSYSVIKLIEYKTVNSYLKIAFLMV